MGCPELSLVEEGSKVTHTNVTSEIPPAHIETLCPEGLTYIFGCGHVGAATARVLTAAGFAVVACDDQPRHVDARMGARRLHRRLVALQNLDELCPISPRNLVVVATAGHNSDIDVVIQAMRAKPAIWVAWARVARSAFVGPLEPGALRRTRSTSCACRSELTFRRRTPRESPVFHRRRDDPPAPHQTRPPQALVAFPYMSCGEIRTVYAC